MNAYKRMNAYSCTGIFVLIVEAAYLIKEKNFGYEKRCKKQ
jgi:hypothetical protein